MPRWQLSDRRSLFLLQGSDGLDVVLNSLSHDNFIGRSLGLLARGGRFVEIGKRDVWSAEKAGTALGWVWQGARWASKALKGKRPYTD